MRALNSHVVLIDLHSSSWHRGNNHHVPTSTSTSSLSYLNKFSSSSFRRRGILRCATTKSSPASPEIRRPSDRFSAGNGSSPASTTSTELEMFLQLLPLKMRRELYRHREIGGLIEVVMDLGRKPLARFPSGDWVISQHPINHDDLHHAISKVNMSSAFSIFFNVFLLFNSAL